MAVSSWFTTPALNITVGGVNIAEGCAPAGLNNAAREIMAGVKLFYDDIYNVGLITSGANQNVYILADGAPDPATPSNGDFVINYTP